MEKNGNGANIAVNGKQIKERPREQKVERQVGGQRELQQWKETLKSYRPAAPLPSRTEQEIATEVERLIAKLTLEQKIGQMSQCLGAEASLGGIVESDSVDKLVSEGKVGTILGCTEFRRIFELQRIAVEESPHRIPLLFNLDVIHGFQTIFPVPLAWSCSGIQRGDQASVPNRSQGSNRDGNHVQSRADGRCDKRSEMGTRR